ncbi:hypothetical protein Hrd1104_11225 [Halorhabdus sp. CBA1104]|uniref:hypothetical protein n=1 Tax=unclassified Halorhabdus TaxID=2621901 RepID=UPI0012B2D199|nr:MULTISPECIES: hypothetical protein [unclassified Halorhabdus]QGN07817.1 hypothetical protein Hrd1104_11225 [Halorhabdus sp. CBA1104]
MESNWPNGAVWGLVGGLSYLVLLQGYELVSAIAVDPLVKFGTALAVTIGASILSAIVGPRLAENVNA